MKLKKFLDIFYNVFLYILAIIGFVFASVFFAMQFGLLNVKGSMSQRNSYFKIDKKVVKGEVLVNSDMQIICKINILSKYAPLTAIEIYKNQKKNLDTEVINQMITLASKRFENDHSFITGMNSCNQALFEEINIPTSSYAWADSDEWRLMKEVFSRDQYVINRAANDAGVPARSIIAAVIGEQFRFFGARRESFKNYFEPLKILASLSQTSYGIAGIKPKTVMQIENNLKDKSSVYYLGQQMEHVLDYKNGRNESEVMTRITNTKDPYYSYLYVGLYIKQIQNQWKNAGYNVDDSPEVYTTLYNLGFYFSKPNDNPKAGGSMIKVSGVDYTYGDLGYEFYYSGELSDIFPIGVQ